MHWHHQFRRKGNLKSMPGDTQEAFNDHAVVRVPHHASCWTQFIDFPSIGNTSNNRQMDPMSQISSRKGVGRGGRQSFYKVGYRRVSG